MELNYKFGRKITEEIKKGRQMHEEMEGKVNIPVMLEPTTWPDSLFKILYTSYLAVSGLRERGKGREIQMYGSIGGYRLSGRIDQLETEGGKVVISDDKTRSDPSPPSDAQILTNKVQMFMYRKMLDDARSGEYTLQNFSRAYQIDKMQLSEQFKRQLRATGVGDGLSTLKSVADAYFDELKGIPEPSARLRVRYIDKMTGDEIRIYSFDYNPEEAQGIIKHVLQFWNGERESEPVKEGEKWKCNHCKFFGEQCKVWWPQGKL
ncbi:MAG: PD-(D/E)XK nuclease family protein [Candidatus Micrarchaeota archaeon]|nr:PD-(D/E)XK nuclease family protein [Candidatus Micrarchaeota archaeon]